MTEDFRPAPSFIADDLRPFDADERSHIPHLSQSFGDRVGDEVPIGEDLKVNVRLPLQEIQQFFVQEWFTAEDTEKGIAHRLGFVHAAVE